MVTSVTSDTWLYQIHIEPTNIGQMVIQQCYCVSVALRICMLITLHSDAMETHISSNYSFTSILWLEIQSKPPALGMW